MNSEKEKKTKIFQLLEKELIRPIFDGAFDVVAIALSAGGVTALSELLAKLPSSFSSTTRNCRKINCPPDTSTGIVANLLSKVNT